LAQSFKQFENVSKWVFLVAAIDFEALK
jgi:hypothetical protein